MATWVNQLCELRGHLTEAILSQALWTKMYRNKECRACGETFTPKAPSNLYCSNECRGRNAYYERNYGITERDLKVMKMAQGNRCFLCGSEGFLIGKKGHHERLAVDHDHETGKVRALLCHNCNRALGLFKDNPGFLRRAAAYIEDHKEGATTIPQGSTGKPPEAQSPQVTTN
jgi:hypothetical protein